MAVKHLKELAEAIDGAIAAFNESMPAVEASVTREISKLLRQLNLSGDTVKVSLENLRLVAQIRGQLEQAILSNPAYVKSLKTYMGAFDDVKVLHTAYFDRVFNGYEASAMLTELSVQTAAATVTSLTRGGLAANIIEPLQGLLRHNVTTSTKYSDLVEMMREFIEGNPDELGHISRYVKQTATDALHQFSSQYMDLAAQDLGLRWFQYDGDIIVKTRPFCKAMVLKRWYHRMEIPAMLRGEINDTPVPIDPDTGKPYAMYPATNKDNFNVYRGGYNCRHTPIPIPEDFVPQEIRMATYEKYGIPHDKEGFELLPA